MLVATEGPRGVSFARSASLEAAVISSRRTILCEARLRLPVEREIVRRAKTAPHLGDDSKG